MKKIFILILITFAIPKIVFSWDKEKTLEVIKKSEILMMELDNDINLQEHIPYNFYTEAIINIRNSRTHLDNKEYNLAYFYSSISIIKLETASFFAKARKNRIQKIILENNYYKKNAQKGKVTEDKYEPGNYKFITYANLFRKDNIYRNEILDNDLFNKTSYLINNKGKMYLDKTIEVMKKFSNTKIKIIGHSSFNDYNKNSEKKSLAIKNYFIYNGIEAIRIETIGAGNRIPMNTPIGFRRIDRIEMIISGID